MKAFHDTTLASRIVVDCCGKKSLGAWKPETNIKSNRKPGKPQKTAGDRNRYNENQEEAGYQNLDAKLQAIAKTPKLGCSMQTRSIKTRTDNIKGKPKETQNSISFSYQEIQILTHLDIHQLPIISHQTE